MPAFIDYIRRICPLSDETANELLACISPCRFARKELIIKANIYNKSAYFIENGITRSYWIVDGKETTTSFSTGGIVFSMDELYFDKPSEEYVEAIEETDTFAISISDLKRLFASNHELCYWGLLIHEIEYRRIHQTHKERLTLPAAKRYEVFQKHFPDLCRRVNLGYIASYLGIDPSTLSRLRGRF